MDDVAQRTQTDTYECALCGRTQEKGVSDAEADSEYREHFGAEAVTGDDRALVCDACWNWAYDSKERRVRTEHFGQAPPWAVPVGEPLEEA